MSKASEAENLKSAGTIGHIKVFPLYTISWHERDDGKFSGYTVRPIIDTSNPSPFKLARLDVPIKYDANKDLDKQVSNNGINAI